LSEPPDWVRAAGEDALLLVHVGPGAARAGLAGFHGPALRVRLRARPVDGAANRELLALLAAALDVRPGTLSIETGLRARDKRVRVEGLGPDIVRARLARGAFR
jgi:hypothetical protein